MFGIFVDISWICSVLFWFCFGTRRKDVRHENGSFTVYTRCRPLRDLNFVWMRSGWVWSWMKEAEPVWCSNYFKLIWSSNWCDKTPHSNLWGFQYVRQLSYSFYLYVVKLLTFLKLISIDCMSVVCRIFFKVFFNLILRIEEDHGTSYFSTFLGTTMIHSEMHKCSVPWLTQARIADGATAQWSNTTYRYMDKSWESSWVPQVGSSCLKHLGEVGCPTPSRS